MAIVETLPDNTFKVGSRIFNNISQARDYLQFARMREESIQISNRYRREMLNDWGEPYPSEGVNIPTARNIGVTHSSSEGINTTSNINTIRRNRGANIDRHVRELIDMQEEMERETAKRRMNEESAKELQRAKNLQKGLDEWGNVYSQDANRWYQKEVEEKKIKGEKELQKMKARLAKNGIDISDELPAYIPPVETVKPKVNGSRKIFILD